MRQRSSQPGGREATGTKPRRRNLQDVLSALVDGHHLTQQQLVHQTGLSRATITRIVSTLMERELIETQRAPEADSGLPAEILSIRPRAGAALSIDFGKSHIRVILRDLDADSGRGGLREETGIDVPRESPRSLDTAVTMAKDVLKESSFAPEDLVGVCIGIPAPVDRPHGRIAVQDSMPDWKQMKPADELRSRLLWDVPMMLENDADLGAMAELEWGAGRGHSNIVYIKWGAGIGGGIVVDGRLVRGGEGLAGEIGHLPVPGFDGPPCKICQIRGCLESLVSAALERNGAAKGLWYIVQAARGEEPGGPNRLLLHEVAKMVGRAIGPVIATLNPEVLVVGGAFRREEGDYNLIANGLREGLQASTLPAPLEVLRIDIGMLTGRASAMGGIALVLRENLRQFLVSRL
jgi:predicted NBD/HSP70 family sugar kinase